MARGIGLSDDVVINKIHLVRKQKVMLDKDLAELYDVTTGKLNKAVKRNLSRFPEDFMFRLTDKEFKDLIFQNGTSSWGGTRKMPYAFTEQGVAMLSSVLNSERAVLVNVHIIRVFTRMRELLSTHKDVLLKLEQLERAVVQHDRSKQYLITCVGCLIRPPSQGVKLDLKQVNRISK